VDIAAWLEGLGLGRYAPAFRDNDVDAGVLPRLTADDLTGLGVASVGHRRKLLDAIAALRAADTSAPSASAGLVSTASPPPAHRLRRAERRQLTVMFADLVGSTALSARLDPEEIGQVLHAYQDAVAGVIARFGGHVAKLMGDGVLAYFGWPAAHEDDAERAVLSGLTALQAVGRLRTPGDENLAARIGIATGLVVIGDLVGEGAAQEEAVVGDTPNLAARLQTLAQPGTVLIGPATRRLIGGAFELEDLGPQVLKGLASPVPAWRVIRTRSVESRFEARATGLTPLVGREQEVALLLDRWRRAKDGKGQTVLLSGEPGVGKSRTVRTVCEFVEGEPHLRLRYQCSPLHTSTAFHPFVGQLERAAGFAHDDTAAAKLDKLEALLAQGTVRVGEVAPLLAAMLSIPIDGRYPPLAHGPERQRELTIEALVEQLVGLAWQQPVLCAFEDLHWADPSTLDVLDPVIERLGCERVLLLLTCRPEFAPPWRSRSRITAHSLSRLPRRQSAALAERVTGGKALPPEVLEEIVARTDGVPLFIEELTRTVLESGLLRDAGDRYVTTGPLPPPAIPSTLHDSLMARLDRSAPMREVAQIGAAIGREFRHDLLAAVAPTGTDDVNAALGELVASGLVTRHGTPPHAVYTFKHALVQDAAYQSLLKSRRQPLHARVADVLEQRFPGTAEAQPELLARHFAEAGLPARAISYWRQAGERALARSGTKEALAHLASGLAALGALPQGVERQRLEVELRLALGQMLRAAKGTAAPETEAAFRQAREVCAQAGDDAGLAQALHGLALCHYNRADLAVAHATGSEFLVLAEQGGDPNATRKANETLGYISFALGHQTAARSHLEKATALTLIPRHEADPDPQPVDRQLPSTLVYLAWSLWILGYPDQALLRCRGGLALAASSPDPFAATMAIGNAATFYLFRRDTASALREADRLIALTQARGIPYWPWLGDFVRGWALSEEGQAEAGLATMRRAAAEMKLYGYLIQVPHELVQQAQACARARRTAEGLALLSEAQEAVERTGERSQEAELHRTRAELLLARDAVGEAEAEQSLGRALAVARA
jgi:class 3 adenylate cyclase/predicted ATPase